MHDENCYIHDTIYSRRKLLNTSPNFLKTITNFYLNNASFCNGFLHNLHKSQFFFFDCKNYLKKQDQHWIFLLWLALQVLAFWLPWFWRVQDRSWRGLMQAWVKAMTDSNWVSSRCWCIGCASGGKTGCLWFGTLTTNSAEGIYVKSKSCF